MKTLLVLSLIGFAAASQAHSTLFEGSFVPEGAGGRTGSGTLSMDYDEDGHTLLINATFSGLSGTTTTAHIHCCTALPNTGTAGVALGQQPENRLPGFTLGIKSGTYTRVIDLTLANQYSATFLTASGGTTALAETRLINGLKSGNAYFNIHTSTFGGGEIRAFVTQVPEPGTYAMMLAGVGVLGWAARRKQRSA